MKLRVLSIYGIILLLVLLAGCDVVDEGPDGKTTETATNVRGSVVRSDNLSAIEGAIVFDASGSPRDTTKSDGSFTLRYNLTARYTGKVIALKPGFGNDTANVVLSPGVDTTISLKVKADTTSPITGGRRSLAASIVLMSITEQNVSVRGSGLNETSFLTFEVRDSSGTPVGTTNKVTVNFSIQGGPGGGEYVFPVSQETDQVTGRVTTRVTSGTRAGILQVYASTVVAGQTLRSSPVRMTISGGLPVQERFTIAREKANVAGGVFPGLRTRITVYAGDRDGNPVVPNTAIYFTTNGGIIQPSAQTDKDGIASVELITGNPQPPGGRATITARTVGDSGVVVSRTIPVVFSGRTVISGPTASFTILDAGTYSFTYRVQDSNGNPLVGGSNVSVTASGPGAADLQLSGDNNVTIPDTDNPSFTQFAATVRDPQEGGASGPVTITIRVTSENGNATYTFSGEVLGQQAIIQPPPSARLPAQIAFIGVTASDIFVSGVGALENSVLTYEVRDSLGTPIDRTRRAYATYSTQFFPNTFVSGGTAPRTIPSADSTDDTGRLRVSLNSGTRSGVVQVVVSVNTPGGVIRSQPVRVSINSGFPDQLHFSIFSARRNFPGLDLFNVRLPITVQVADRYSNPVQAGTVVYFNTQHGVIQTTGASTDGNGFVTKELNSANPSPEGVNAHPILGPGFSYVYARTIGENGALVLDSLLLLWTGRPVITNTSSTTTFTIANGGSAGPFTFTVMDRLGHVMSAGTRLSVAGPGLTVSGDADVLIDDSFLSGAGRTTFTVTISDASPSVVTAPPFISILTLTVNHPVYGIYTRVLATGTVQ